MRTPDWPNLKIAFATKTSLIEPEDSGWVGGLPYLCDIVDPREDSLGIVTLLWKGRVLTGQVAREIEAVRSSSQDAQVYEAYVTYTQTEEDPVPKDAKTVTLKALSGDLCFGLFDWGLLAADGRPLRIERALVERALGTLPRTLELPVP